VPPDTTGAATQGPDTESVIESCCDPAKPLPEHRQTKQVQGILPYLYLAHSSPRPGGMGGSSAQA
jgi:hypothetical protein